MRDEQTLILFKPDAVNRGLIGEVISRFEKKGLKITGLKMLNLSDEILTEHYAHHKDKDFFPLLKNFMQKSPVLAMVLEGFSAIKVVRDLTGPTAGYEAPAGTIRGDYAISERSNIIHASEDAHAAATEIKRFFRPDEIFSYQRIDDNILYAEEEK